MLPPRPHTPRLHPPDRRNTEATSPKTSPPHEDGAGLTERDAPSPSGSPDPTSGESARGRYWPELDGIRGLAVTAVVLYHFAGFITPEMCRRSQAWNLIRRAAGSGWCGVDLFFVLSGLLITGILYDAKGTRHFFRNFYARRTLRIAPLYYGVLLAVFVVGPLLVPRSAELHRLAQDQPWFWLYSVNFLRVIRGPGSCDAGGLNLEHFWSLAVEEHFYLVWPLVVFALRRRPLMIACVGMAVLSSAIRLWFVARGEPVAAYMLTFCRLDGLAVGSFLALATRGGGAAALRPQARLAAIAAGTILFAMFARNHGILYAMRSDTQILGYPLLAVFFGAATILALGPCPWASLCRARVLRFLGRHSYGIYVYHFLLLNWVRSFAPEGRLAGAVGSESSYVLLLITALSISTLVLSVLSLRFYESKFLSLKALIR